jgi:hypothetical protein
METVKSFVSLLMMISKTDFHNFSKQKALGINSQSFNYLADALRLYKYANINPGIISNIYHAWPSPSDKGGQIKTIETRRKPNTQ